MSTIDVAVPDGIKGEFRIESFQVTAEDVKRNFRGFLRPSEYVPEGHYKRLMRGQTVVMSNTPMEINTNYDIIRRANGRVLINGLGIGMVLTAILQKPEVSEVWVIEKYQEVIDLVGPTFAADPRVKIIHADALEYKPPKGMKFDCVWHDIWDFICSDNLEEMAKLHRRYGNRTKWQGSWSKEQCLYNRRRDKRSYW